MANRKLVVEIVGDSRSLERSMASASRSVRGFSVGVGSLVKSAAVIGGVTAAVGGISAAVRAGVGEFTDATKAAAQTAAAIRSTGGIANVTARDVTRLASAVQAYAGIDDEAVQAGENLLLTFKNVRNEVGRGNAVFDRATKAAVDLSVAGFGSVESTAKQLGKALNDPVRGMTALGRAGVTFTAQQREAIKRLVETNRTLDAQKLILREVESQVGGSARALGQTLPGQLARLRESFKNTLGDLVGRVAPAVAGALGQFTDFLDDLGRARTVHAKLRVTLDRLEGLATALTSRVGDAVAAIDWDAIWARARGVADGLQRQLEQVDFSAVGKRIGDAFADAAKVALPAAKDLADRISQAVDAIDWEKLGKAMGPGLAAAVVTAFVTITDPGFWARNWDLALAVALTVFTRGIGRIATRIAGEFAGVVARALERVSPAIAAAFRGLAIQAVRGFAAGFAGLARLLGPLERTVIRLFGRLGRAAVFTVKVLGVQAAINAVVGFSRTVGGLMGRLARSISGALNRAWERVERDALRAALRVVEPFTHIPGFIGAPFRKAKEAMQQQLAGMVTSAEQTATRIQTAIDRIEGRRVQITIDTVVNAPGGPRRPEEGAARAAGDAAARSTAATAKAADTATKAAAAGATTATAAAGAAEKSATKTQTAAQRARAAATRQRKAFDSLVDSIGLSIDRDLARKAFAKALADNTALQNSIRAQIRVEGNTTELERQLLDAQQQRAQIISDRSEAAAAATARAAARLQARQFRALGLTGTGDQRTPGVANLRKQLEQLTARLGPDVAPKIAGQLKRVGDVLSGSVGKVTEQTRAKILELFQTIRGTLTSESSKEVTGPGFRKTGFQSLIAGIPGLDPQQIKALRSRFVQRGPGGTMPTPGFGAFGLAFPRQPGLAGGVAGGVTNEVHVFVGGRELSDVVVREVQKRGSSSTALRTGVSPGANRGMG